MTTWVIVRTELKHELRVYRALVEIGVDAWLPLMPGFTRAHRTVKHRREWWKPTMPTIFFACLDPVHAHRLDGIPFCRGIERRWTGEAIVLSDVELLRFRKGIDAENRELLRIGRRIAAEREPRQIVRARKPSKRIARPSEKRPVRAEQLRQFTSRLIKDQTTPPCENDGSVL